MFDVHLCAFQSFKGKHCAKLTAQLKYLCFIFAQLLFVTCISLLSCRQFNEDVGTNRSIEILFSIFCTFGGFESKAADFFVTGD